MPAWTTHAAGVRKLTVFEAFQCSAVRVADTGGSFFPAPSVAGSRRKQAKLAAVSSFMRDLSRLGYIS